MTRRTPARGASRIAVCALAAVGMLAPHAMADLGRIAFPSDPAVLDARRDLGAKGDGVADDTEALQRGLDMSCGLDGGPTKVLYLPNGTYRVTGTLVVKAGVGPWLYGETRDGVVVRLDDGVNSVLRTHPRESGPTSADWFERNIRNLTIDVGENPQTDGIRYCSTNTGIIQHVRVIGHGKVGINSGFIDQSSPNLIQDVEIDGFETGILSRWTWGQTLSRVTIRNCSRVGLEVTANALGVEDLVVENTPLAVLNTIPNDWPHWGGVIALIGGRFSGGNRAGPAIRNESVLYARDVVTEGYARALERTAPGGSVDGPDITEYSSHEVKSLFDSPAGALRLPVEREPEVLWETDPAKWVCVNDFGAVAGDNQDDTAAFQQVFDRAAAEGKTTVCVRGIGGSDPNWYDLRGEIRVRGSVRHVLGLGFGRILNPGDGRFVVDDESAPVVKFQNIDAMGGPPVTVENRSRAGTMVVESCSVRIVGAGAGDIFATDCPSLVDLQSPGQRMWARQLNPEGNDDIGVVRNAGADLWALGAKCEGKGVRFRTSDGGRTEIMGGFFYDPGDMTPDDARPMFDIDNASLCAMGIREIAFGGAMFSVKVRERRGEETRTLRNDREGGWIGWSLFSGWPRPAGGARDGGRGPAAPVNGPAVAGGDTPAPRRA